MCKSLEDQNMELMEENMLLRQTLEVIAEWNCFPDVTLDDGSVVPYSYAYGSNGERSFIKKLAREVLIKKS